MYCLNKTENLQSVIIDSTVNLQAFTGRVERHASKAYFPHKVF